VKQKAREFVYSALTHRGGGVALWHCVCARGTVTAATGVRWHGERKCMITLYIYINI
jgi:hypothetical protein